NELARALRAARLHDVALGRDRGEAGPGAALEELDQRPRLHRHRVDREQCAIVREVAHSRFAPRRALSPPSPLVGEGWGGGWCGGAPRLPHMRTPTPNPSPQGGGERTESAARRGELKHRARAHHASTPRVASTARMRVAARSGSAMRPAESARRNSSARCSVERALSWPPTKVKLSCRPLR